MSQTTASTDTNTPYPAWSTSGGLDAPHSAGESTGAPAPTVLQSAASMVYLSYTPETLPPKPPGSWTRFVCVSDTHTRAFPVPPGDVLLHGGDLTHVGRVAEFRKTVGWLSSLPHPQKIIIAGNHDLTLHQADEWYAEHWRMFVLNQDQPEPIEPILDLLKGDAARAAGIVYLQDEKYEFKTRPDGRTWSVWGSPWSPWFWDWAFNYERGEVAERLIRAIPPTDILLTHGPPHDLLDLTAGSDRVGCEALRAALDAGRLHPRLHVFGHIHEAHGALVRPAPAPSVDSTHPDGAETVFVNAANWPAGPRARDHGVSTPFGGGDFVPVVVDLLDEPGSSDV